MAYENPPSFMPDVRKSLMSEKLSARNSGAGNGSASSMGAWDFLVLSAENTLGGYLGFGAGGRTNFIFMGAGIFLNMNHFHLGVSQRPLTLILPQKYRDTNGRRIVIQIGGVYTTSCHREGIHLQKYAIEMGGVSRYFFTYIGVRGRFDSPDSLGWGWSSIC